MQISGSIQSENVEVAERERMQRLMRDFIAGLQKTLPRDLTEVSYKVRFWRPFFGAKIDAVIEFRAGPQDAWYARANGADPWRAFTRALGNLKQIILEMEIREDESNANRKSNSA